LTQHSTDSESTEEGTRVSLGETKQAMLSEAELREKLASVAAASFQHGALLGAQGGATALPWGYPTPSPMMTPAPVPSGLGSMLNMICLQQHLLKDEVSKSLKSTHWENSKP
jgi:hypothetical protein